MDSSSRSERAERIARIMQENNKVRWMFCDFLERDPRLITPELLESARGGGILSEESAYVALLGGFCDMDPDSGSDEEIHLLEDYFRPSVRRLDPRCYREDPYFRDMEIPETSLGKWELVHQVYAPCEAFVRDDLLLEEDFREIPRLGFFTEEFRFPALLEGGRDWMAIKPSEIETSRHALEAAHGRVVTFGLGLGYFAYLASLKQEVESVVVVERDESVIELFERHIHPRFRTPGKVRVECRDAFDYVQGPMSGSGFDFAFVDLWHDASDGVEPYLRMRRLEKLHPGVEFVHWLETSLLSALRWRIFQQLLDRSDSPDDLLELLDKRNLRSLANHALFEAAA